MVDAQFHDKIISELKQAGVSNHNLHKRVIHVLLETLR